MLLLDCFTVMSSHWETRDSVGNDEHPCDQDSVFMIRALSIETDGIFHIITTNNFHGVSMPSIVDPFKGGKEPR